MPSIIVENVHKNYTINDNSVGELYDINLAIEQGEFVFVVSDNRSEVSALLSIISGAMPVDKGAVYYDDEPIEQVKENSKNNFNRIVGVVQHHFELDAMETVFHTLDDFSRIEKFKAWFFAENPLKKALSLLGIENCIDKRILELSVTDRCKVQVARAICHSPSILIIDEILEGMDSDSVWDLFHLLSELSRQGTTVIIADDNEKHANILCKHIIKLADGKVIEHNRRGLI